MGTTIKTVNYKHKNPVYKYITELFQVPIFIPTFASEKHILIRRKDNIQIKITSVTYLLLTNMQSDILNCKSIIYYCVLGSSPSTDDR